MARVALIYGMTASKLECWHVDMEYAIDIRNIVKAYDGRVRALDGVNLAVDQTDVFALLGPNGSGKTTLMRMLTTQIRPTSGAAYILGHDVVKEDARVRKIIGYVPQETSVWMDISGYENLLIYSKIYGIPSGRRKENIWDALSSMGLEPVANNMVKTYSGGMVRRLEIACAMLIKPQIMFLDEPTIGLDPSARKAVWDNLTSFKKEYGTTVFFNTHYMDEADQYADRLAIIVGGRVVKEGSAKELKQSVHKESISLRISPEKVDSSVLDRLRALEYVSDVSNNSSELSVMVKDAHGELPEIIEVLRMGKISVKRVSIDQPSMDDVFLKYAGRIHTKAMEDQADCSEAGYGH